MRYIVCRFSTVSFSGVGELPVLFWRGGGGGVIVFLLMIYECIVECTLVVLYI